MNSPPYLLFFRRGKHMFLLSIYWTAAPLTKSHLRWWLKTFMESSMEYKWFIYLSWSHQNTLCGANKSRLRWMTCTFHGRVLFWRSPIGSMTFENNRWAYNNGIWNSRRTIKNVWPAAGAGATWDESSTSSKMLLGWWMVGTVPQQPGFATDGVDGMNGSRVLLVPVL